MEILKHTLFVSLAFASVIQGRAQATLWGMTWNSAGGFGTIYNAATGGSSVNTQYTFMYTSEGTDPMHDQPAQTSSGKFYGVTYGGGLNNAGVLYEYDLISGLYVKHVDFAAYGCHGPLGSLFLAGNGKLYGLTSAGGSNNGGVLFEFDPVKDSFAKKHDFSASTTGSYPCGSLMQAGNGKLYGLTAFGGANNAGTLFEFDALNGLVTKRADFATVATGNGPHGSLIQAGNGLLYGLTRYGGISGNGVIFAFDPLTNTLTKKFDFNGNQSTAKGGEPYGSLVEAQNGKLYGMCKEGGTNNFGTLFEYNPANDSCYRIVSFNGSIGKWPLGSLTKASDGNLYGMTWQGGGQGNIFRFSPLTVAFTNLHYFNSPHGQYPYGTLRQGANGKFYGVTSTGGLKNKGTFFEYDAVNNVYVKKFDFNHNLDGGVPTGPLLLTSDKKMFGLTYSGGKYNHGVLFEFDHLTATYSKKLDLNGPLTGANPWDGLIEAGNGKLYGMANGGGSAGAGVIFEYDRTADTLTIKVHLNSSIGRNPFGTLLEAANNKLYGLTRIGGANGQGVLFEYDPATGVYQKKVDFTGAANGGYPQGNLLQATNGKLYGLTSAGGTSNWGTLFEYDITNNTLSKKTDFTGTVNGRYPYGDLVQAGNGKLYGLTHAGGANNKGVIFEFDPAGGTFTKKYDFNTGGAYPSGKMTLSANGKLYGTTEYGGTGNTSVMFEYDPSNNTYTKLLDYANSPAGDLIELCTAPAGAGAIAGASTLCAGPGATISISTTNIQGADTYSWVVPANASIISGAGSNSVVADLSGLPAGTYSISTGAVNACGDGARSAITVTVHATPVVTAGSGSICAGSSFTIIPSGASSYSVQGGSFIVSPALTTTYAVTGVSAEGCESHMPAVSVITVQPLPVLTAQAQPTMICEGESAVLSVNGSNTYTWSEASTSPVIIVSPQSTTTYTVRGTDANGCVGEATVTQHVSGCASLAETAGAGKPLVFPNPFSDRLSVVAGQGYSKVTMYDIAGRCMGMWETDSEDMDVSALPPGLYLLEIVTGEKPAWFRVIKE